MTTESNGNATNGNGTQTPEVKVSAISRLLKEHNEATDGGKKAPDKKVTGPLLATFKKLLAERDAAQVAFDKATKAFTEHAPAMVKTFGDKKISIGGRLYFPASRGETVFYREQGKQDPGDIVEA